MRRRSTNKTICAIRISYRPILCNKSVRQSTLEGARETVRSHMTLMTMMMLHTPLKVSLSPMARFVIPQSIRQTRMWKYRCIYHTPWSHNLIELLITKHLPKCVPLLIYTHSAYLPFDYDTYKYTGVYTFRDMNNNNNNNNY